MTLSMSAAEYSGSLETRIAEWRTYLGRRQAVHSTDVLELEDHLREQIAILIDAGLTPDEAFMVGVKRMGGLDALSREFAIEHADRLWKQLVLAPPDAGVSWARNRLETIVAWCLAVLAAVLVKAPMLFGMDLDRNDGFYARNASLFVLPLLVGYFIWKRGSDRHTIRWLVAGIVAAGIFANVYPYAPNGSTDVLTALHLPIALWLIVGIAYAGGRWAAMSGRMDFIRFSGELFVYYVLIALGGGVLVGFMAMTFASIGIDAEPFFESWILPCSAAGAVVIASWLVEAKQSVIENIAPVLTRLFTPFFAIMLVTFLGAMVWNGRRIDIERDVLIAFDLLLLLVLGLVLYAISARDPRSPPDAFDAMQLVLVVSALVADTVALWAIASRISEFGFSPNRVAGLGINILLLINLAWTAMLAIRFLTGRGTFTALERWQTDYLPIYAGWGAIVVILFPPLFGYT